jgi:hypothetical protein
MSAFGLPYSYDPCRSRHEWKECERSIPPVALRIVPENAMVSYDSTVAWTTLDWMASIPDCRSRFVLVKVITTKAVVPIYDVVYLQCELEESESIGNLGLSPMIARFVTYLEKFNKTLPLFGPVSLSAHRQTGYNRGWEFLGGRIVKFKLIVPWLCTHSNGYNKEGQYSLRCIYFIIMFHFLKSALRRAKEGHVLQIILYMSDYEEIWYTKWYNRMTWLMKWFYS